MIAECEVNLSNILGLAVEVTVVHIVLGATRGLLVNGLATAPHIRLRSPDGQDHVTKILDDVAFIRDVPDSLLERDLPQVEIEVVQEGTTEDSIAQILIPSDLVVRPRRKAVRISGRAVIMFVLAFIGFKAFLIANLGMLTYEERVTRLQSGTMVERAGAFVMQADPLSIYVALQVGPILR